MDVLPSTIGIAIAEAACRDAPEEFLATMRQVTANLEEIFDRVYATTSLAAEAGPDDERPAASEEPTAG